MTKEELLDAIRKTGAFTEYQIAIYVREAEDQDGLDYWSQFDNPSELAEDMNLYFGA